MQTGEVAEHAQGEFGFGRRLRFDVNQKECLPTAEAHLGDQVGLVAVAGGDVGEDLLVQEFDPVAIEVLRHLRQEQLDELEEEGRQQFLKQSIVIDHAAPSFERFHRLAHNIGGDVVTNDDVADTIRQHESNFAASYFFVEEHRIHHLADVERQTFGRQASGVNHGDDAPAARVIEHPQPNGGIRCGDHAQRDAFAVGI